MKKLVVSASLSVMMVDEGLVEVKNDQDDNLVIQIERLTLLALLPFGKLRALSVLKDFSNRLEQTIILSVANKKWLTFYKGHVRFNNLWITVRSVLNV
jgi:hypothetical protein